MISLQTEIGDYAKKTFIVTYTHGLRCFTEVLDQYGRLTEEVEHKDALRANIKHWQIVKHWQTVRGIKKS